MHSVTSAFNETLAIASWAWPWAVSSWRTYMCTTKKTKVRWAQRDKNEIYGWIHVAHLPGRLQLSQTSSYPRCPWEEMPNGDLQSPKRRCWTANVVVRSLGGYFLGCFLCFFSLLWCFQEDIPGAAPFCERLTPSSQLCRVVRDEDAALSARPLARACDR